MSDEPQTPEPAPETRMELPTWNRSRTKRKSADAGPTDDAFQGAVRQAGRSAVRSSRMVILAAILGAAGVIGVVLYRATSETSKAKATRLLATAAAMESRGKIGDVQTLLGPTEHPPFPIAADEAARKAVVDGALTGLESTAKGSGPATAGELLRGAEHMREGDFAAAEAAYRSYLADEPKSSLAFLAREGLALAREGQGDIDGALGELRTLAGDKGAFYREMALYHQARLLAAAERKDEAIKVLKTYADEYPLGEPSLAREQIRGLAEVVDPALLAGSDRPPSVEILDGEGAAPDGAP